MRITVEKAEGGPEPLSIVRLLCRFCQAWRILFLLLLLPFSLALPCATGQERSEAIELALVELRLGEPRDVVLRKLSKNAMLQNVEAGDSSWLVYEKDISPKRLMGNIAFTNGKLSFVSKQWRPDDQQKGAEFARALYGAISQFQREGLRVCVISAGQTQNPKAEIRNANITCGKKYISIGLVRTEEDGESAYVAEILASD